MKILHQFIAFTLSIFLSVSHAQTHEEERILSMDIDIVVSPSGELDITETIRVYVAGEKIKRGIYRTLPKYRKLDNGDQKIVHYSIQSLYRNGQIENYHERKEKNEYAYYFGNQSIFLESGEHTYVFRYTVKEQIGFFSDYDELYWNVVGTEWDFAIEQATATITLPKGAAIATSACYTGSKGSKENDCQIEPMNEYKVKINSQKTLPSRHGLTVVLAFEKGFVQASLLTVDQWFLSGLFSLCFFFVVLTWWYKGRDSKKLPVIPTFDPPNNWSAAAVALFNKKNESLVLSCLFIGLAVKRAVKIIVNSDSYYIKVVNDRPKNLTKDEWYTLQYIIKEKGLTIERKGSSKITSFKQDIVHRIKSYIQWDSLFIKNVRYQVFGYLLIMAIHIVVLFWFLSIDELLFAIFPTALLFFMYPFVCAFLTDRKYYLAIVFGILPFLVTELFVADDKLPTLVSQLSLFSVVYVLLYRWLIRRKTSLAAEKKAHCEGLKLYLEKAEEHRFDRLNEPEQSLVFYETLLPYAVAFGLENRWAERFYELLKTTQPAWISNKSSESLSFSDFHHGFNRSVLISSHYVQPSSSSSSYTRTRSSRSWSSGRSGGGGFSGRGGGGGGGGGW